MKYLKFSLYMTIIVAIFYILISSSGNIILPQLNKFIKDNEKVSWVILTLIPAFISLVSALLVTFLNNRSQEIHMKQQYEMQMEQFTKQQDILARIDSTKARETRRQEALRFLNDTLDKANKGVEHLVKHISTPDKDLVVLTTEAFRQIGGFSENMKNLENSLDLNEDEKQLCRLVEASLVDVLLTLDFDGAQSPDSKYVNDLKIKANAFKAENDKLICIICQRYRGH